MNNVGDAFGWAFRDPQWPGKIVVQGLILIIPIVGWIAMTGWLLLAFENARAGKNELPPAGFHLARGIAMFGVFFVYGVALQIPASAASSASGAASGQGNGALFALAFLLWFLGSIVLNFLVPSLIVNTYHRGFGGGMDIQRVWQLATADLNNSLVAGLIVFVVSVIGGLGFVCLVGFIFTIPFQNAVMAGVAAWYEKTQPAAPAAAA